jgi:predicted metal-dependent phosphotriesterase family hydrolase
MHHNPRFDGREMSYLHIHRNVLPKLREAGVSEAQIDEMLVANARRFLAVQR